MDKFLRLKTYLDCLVRKFESPDFIDYDPIIIPHSFEDPQDQEVIGLFAALLAWGQRKTLLKKLEELCERMSYKPMKFVYDFSSNPNEHALSGFKHRTFQPSDAISLITNVSLIIREFGSLENAFSYGMSTTSLHIETGLQAFSNLLFDINPSTPGRLRKHLARPNSGSACKRFCMYLRWMVRPGPVDLAVWKSVDTSQLVLPLDVHSGRQSRSLGMLDRSANNWKAALELTRNCRLMSPQDPARYDFAFFGLGVNNIPIDPQFIDKNRIEVSKIAAPFK